MYLILAFTILNMHPLTFEGTFPLPPQNPLSSLEFNEKNPYPYLVEYNQWSSLGQSDWFVITYSSV